MYFGPESVGKEIPETGEPTQISTNRNTAMSWASEIDGITEKIEEYPMPTDKRQ